MIRKNKIKNLYVLLALTLMIMMGAHSASAEIEQLTNTVIDVEVRVQRTSDDTYELSLTNQAGTEKKIIGPSVNDFTKHTFKLNYGLNESKHCTRSSNIINQYTDLTDTMSSMLGVCEGAVKQYNVSETYVRQLSEAQMKQTEFESLWNVEKNKREDLEKKSTSCTTELEQLKKDNARLENVANIANTNEAKLSECKEDLEDAEADKTNQLILGIALGVGGGYFFWGRNNKSANQYDSRMPPEQEDAAGYDY